MIWIILSGLAIVGLGLAYSWRVDRQIRAANERLQEARAEQCRTRSG